MNYTSLIFLTFIAVVALVYYTFPFKSYKWTVLLTASYVFYFFTGAKYAAFIILTTVTTYITAIILDKVSKNAKKQMKLNKEQWSKEEKKKFKKKTDINKRLIMTLCLVLNFGILAFLKYYNFFATSFFSLPTLKLFLPLGISFYTFQSMGYVVDVYRETVPAEKNIAKLALFVSFFPQIIQGPIGIYDSLATQLYTPHKFSYDNLSRGVRLMMWGYFKKLVIADRAVMFINSVTDDYISAGGGILLLTVLMYALQLYADFSGGIDITRGVAEIFGINLSENFKRPYFATTISDYWRRWHISLGEWFKSYLFYPVAMSGFFTKICKKIRTSKFGKTSAGVHISKVLPTSIASLVVFFMVGVWHGANWKYVAFGLWNGVIIMISTLLKPCFDYINVKLHIKTDNMAFQIFQMFRTFAIVLVGYVFDVAPDFSLAVHTFKNIFSFSGLTAFSKYSLSVLDFAVLFAGMIVIFVSSVIQEKNTDTDMREILSKRPVLNWVLMFLCIAATLVFGIYGPGYDAADFVYMQF